MNAEDVEMDVEDEEEELYQPFQQDEKDDEEGKDEEDEKAGSDMVGLLLFSLIWLLAYFLFL